MNNLNVIPLISSVENYPNGYLYNSDGEINTTTINVTTFTQSQDLNNYFVPKYNEGSNPPFDTSLYDSNINLSLVAGKNSLTLLGNKIALGFLFRPFFNSKPVEDAIIPYKNIQTNTPYAIYYINNKEPVLDKDGNPAILYFYQVGITPFWYKIEILAIIASVIIGIIIIILIFLVLFAFYKRNKVTTED